MKQLSDFFYPRLKLTLCLNRQFFLKNSAEFVRYDNLSAFEKYLTETALQQLSSIYFILGKDLIDNQESIDLLLRFLLPSAEMKEFGLTLFDGAQLGEAALGDALDSTSFFAKTRVIWIQQFDKSKKTIQEKLEKYFCRPQQGLYLLLSAASWQKNSGFYKAIDKEGIVVDLAELKPWEKEKRLIAWVNKQAAAYRKLMSYSVSQLLVKRIGNDQALLNQELEKLICYCLDKQEITEQDVEKICSQQHVETIWQLGEAIFRRDVATALQIGSTFLVEGQPFLPLLRQIRSQFQTEYQVCLLLAQGKPAQEITQQFPYMKGQILERHIQQAQQYGLTAFKKGLLAIDAAEIKAKNSSIDERILLELLMMQLTSRD